MKTLAQIQQRKQEFLTIYNPKSDIEVALTSGLKAASQHNDLYTPCINRQPIRNRWKAILLDIGEKYVNNQIEEVFFNDIDQLKEQMNSQFNGQLNNDGGRYDLGFRTSHAQKSLSVYLKHLWCMGQIEQPPFCPIDSNILRLVNYPDPRWCYVNTRELYLSHVKAVKAGKNANPLYEGDSIAVWELFEF